MYMVDERRTLPHDTLLVNARARAAAAATAAPAAQGVEFCGDRGSSGDCGSDGGDSKGAEFWPTPVDFGRR